MLHPARISSPFIVGFVGFEKISIAPFCCFCELFENVVDVDVAFKCFFINSSSLIVGAFELVGLIMFVVVVDGVEGGVVVEGCAEKGEEHFILKSF